MTAKQIARNSSSAPRYTAVGVDVDANDRLIPQFSKKAAEVNNNEYAGEVGAFSGLYKLKSGDPRHTLVASTDGVGTKVLVASLAGRVQDIGRDLVNHCINDILTAGAEPLFFLDYLAGNGLSEKDKLDIVGSVADACLDAKIALLGGETADMPDLYIAGYFDLAGTIVGIVGHDRASFGEQIAADDALLALPSNGLHTNGYSLAREALGLRGDDSDRQSRRDRLFDNEDKAELDGECLADALLKPHTSYRSALCPVLGLVKGLAHITGGGIGGNLERILPEGLGAELKRGTWAEPPIFGLIQRRGGIETAEMFRVFNMGVGMIAAAAPADVDELLVKLEGAVVVGQVVSRGEGERVRVRGL